MLPSVAGALSSSGAISGDPAVLNDPYWDRYIWDSPNPYGYNGWAFFDGGRRFGACDKARYFNLYRDNQGGGPGRSPYPLGVTAGWSPNATYYTIPEYASAAVSAVDTSNLCHGVAASRDGDSLYFSTDSADGTSRIFNFWGWVRGGAPGQAPRIFSVAGNSYFSAAPRASNRLGVANTWVPPTRTTAAPQFKGLAQAPSGLTLGVLNALFATEGGLAGRSVLVTPSSSGAAGSFDVRCAPGFFGAPLLALSAPGAAAALSSLATRCSPCTRPAALDATVFVPESTNYTAVDAVLGRGKALVNFTINVKHDIKLQHGERDDEGAAPVADALGTSDITIYWALPRSRYEQVQRRRQPFAVIKPRGDAKAQRRVLQFAICVPLGHKS